ncbi:polysaccharide deacetylase family protein [Nonlabens ponticola]|uniref:Polysaccharide deacetylase family protein n=1 Tax=Nonlabens ponticola TaxID=2496866 RepID=A0A3S9MUS2_9FLAO|nr:polysaccharide deacetylase family protein [Nonlabens ponticola]AZQ42922.1 polysaccharide deacetylase family protein [Nonlabens ponticola]
MRWYPDRIPDWISSLFPNYTWHKNRSTKTIYLTFDDGPTPIATSYVLELLDKFNFKATFFLIGDRAQRYPELKQQLIDHGHSIGNHTHNHLNAWKTSNNEYLDNVAFAKANTSNKLFRPPYGRVRPGITNALIKEDYEIVLWDVLSGDFDVSRTAESCLKNLMNATRNGSIIVFHDSDKSYEKLQKILPNYFRWLRNRGYKSARL